MSVKEEEMRNTECSELCDVFKMVIGNTIESEVNNETTAYGLAKVYF